MLFGGGGVFVSGKRWVAKARIDVCLSLSVYESLSGMCMHVWSVFYVRTLE